MKIFGGSLTYQIFISFHYFNVKLSRASLNGVNTSLRVLKEFKKKKLKWDNTNQLLDVTLYRASWSNKYFVFKWKSFDIRDGIRLLFPFCRVNYFGASCVSFQQLARYWMLFFSTVSRQFSKIYYSAKGGG
jgi:hypothetical protein